MLTVNRYIPTKKSPMMSTNSRIYEITLKCISSASPSTGQCLLMSVTHISLDRESYQPHPSNPGFPASCSVQRVSHCQALLNLQGRDQLGLLLVICSSGLTKSLAGQERWRLAMLNFIVKILLKCSICSSVVKIYFYPVPSWYPSRTSPIDTRLAIKSYKTDPWADCIFWSPLLPRISSCYSRLASF